MALNKFASALVDNKKIEESMGIDQKLFQTKKADSPTPTTINNREKKKKPVSNDFFDGITDDFKLDIVELNKEQLEVIRKTFSKKADSFGHYRLSPKAKKQLSEIAKKFSDQGLTDITETTLIKIAVSFLALDHFVNKDKSVFSTAIKHIYS